VTTFVSEDSELIRGAFAIHAWEGATDYFDRWEAFRKAVQAGLYNEGEGAQTPLPEPTHHTHMNLVWSSWAQEDGWLPVDYECTNPNCIGEK
jgi:hypothetical protein